MYFFFFLAQFLSFSSLFFPAFNLTNSLRSTLSEIINLATNLIMFEAPTLTTNNFALVASSHKNQIWTTEMGTRRTYPE
jgi:hypothetical protein